VSYAVDDDDSMMACVVDRLADKATADVDCHDYVCEVFSNSGFLNCPVHMKSHKTKTFVMSKRVTDDFPTTCKHQAGDAVWNCVGDVSYAVDDDDSMMACVVDRIVDKATDDVNCYDYVCEVFSNSGFLHCPVHF